MKKFKLLLLASVALLFAVACDDDDKTSDGTGNGTDTDVYDRPYGTAEHQNPTSSTYRFSNPVIYADRPDPSVFLAKDGKYYLYSTGGYLHMYSSEDLVNWNYEGTVFESRPGVSTYLWAPDMEYLDGQYVLYYTAHVDGVYSDYVNVATSDSPTGPFYDKGTVVSYTNQRVINSIDECFWQEDDGTRWMFWGSFNGIYAIQLSDDGFSVKSGAEKERVVGSLIEGTMLYKHDGYYYLIGSAGWYDGGASSTYHLVIARSENLLGPYGDRDGNAALSNSMSPFLNASDEVYGPGHNSELLEMPDGTLWFIYHGWPYDNPDYGRVVYLNQILWDSTGWPYVPLNKPSVTWDKPNVTSSLPTYNSADYIEYVGDNVAGGRLFDTGCVPTENTRIEMKFKAYPYNMTGVSTRRYVRRIFQTNWSKGPGFSLYINYDGDKLGFSNYEDSNDGIADLSLAVDYEISATLSTLTVNGQTYSIEGGSASGEWDRITLFNGDDDYPFMGCIYYFKAYEGNTLVRDLEPVVRKEDGFAMFYDTVSGTYYNPYDGEGFGYGNLK